MSNEPNDTIFVDPNTDDLNSFEDLLNGKAQVKNEESTEVEEVETVATEEAPTQEAFEDKEDSVDEQEDSTADDKASKKKPNRFQERINELTAKVREAERAAEALRAANTRQTESTAPTPTPTPSVDNTGPQPDDKNPDGSDKYPLDMYDPDYIRDVARHTIEKEWAVRKEQEAVEQFQRRDQEARSALQVQWEEKLTPVTEQYDDFLDKTLQLESAFDGLDQQYADYLVQTIKSLEHGPEVLYYFANNLDEADKFVKSGPLGATLALGEINSMFKGQTRKPDPKVSKAPPPPQVNKGTKSRTTFTADTDDFDAFYENFFSKT